MNYKSPSVFGTLLGYAPGGVAAYSSDYDTASDIKYPKRSAFRSYFNGIYMGYKWQCVEFARRWMYINKGTLFDDVAMAYEIFDLRTVRNLATNSLLPLQAFCNGSKSLPQPGSLLIWDQGGEFAETGHVAIVTEVFPDKLRIVEQNLDHQIWPEGHSFSRELPATTTEEGEYWLKCSFNDATILGWMTQTEDDRDAEPTLETNKQLFNLISRRAKEQPNPQKSWLNVANEDEAAYVKAMHGHKLSAVTADQYRYYVLSETAQHALQRAANELHALFMHATDYVLENQALLNKFNLPVAILPKIRQSWDNRLNELITSRFDFAMTPQGLKVYEYNCDSASCYMESAKIQGKWARHYGVQEGQDSGKDLFNHLVNAWRKSQAKGLVHILHDNDPEEKYHALFIQQTLKSAGLESKLISAISSLRWNSSGDILDEEGQLIHWVWKTWSWETALGQIRAQCEVDQALAEKYQPLWQQVSPPRLADVLLHKNIMIFEPLWTLIPSNKAILPVLWSLFPNHPLLLHTNFVLNADLQASGYVSKPIVGRCGANIQVVNHHEDILEETGGQFSAQDQIYQALFPLPLVDGYYVQVCAFTAAGKYAGSCLRVDSSMIISKDSDCMALRFVNDDHILSQ
ncbi:fused glutathionylspermidine amidase and glutathionylspermidine synthetase [Psychromonas ingrahamii 37]|uniref:Fused glutathionylspermidine amidase and glutathionylspermidine synthetase n=1 Tax=Psychromonas ingrahamii (strain DSM 17664 / CCUG 51855 / 37) TaxID=357804 RepID=A1SUA0_PSYIN|nr:bifunctional glutathionylspermidine amidase/synthase [Psychromonas ingrahamii]ABM03065.1 fused glutathionylspermidine amidase and glutathionylspermidine synthetase [Psychromonas ingrahamii 37]